VSLDPARPALPAIAVNTDAHPATRMSYRTTGLAVTNVVGIT
jgi:hypothetical protein